MVFWSISFIYIFFCSQLNSSSANSCVTEKYRIFYAEIHKNYYPFYEGNNDMQKSIDNILSLTKPSKYLRKIEETQKEIEPDPVFGYAYHFVAIDCFNRGIQAEVENKIEKAVIKRKTVPKIIYSPDTESIEF